MASTQAIAARRQSALQRVEQATDRLTKAFGVDAMATENPSREAPLAEVERLETMGKYLEQVADAGEKLPKASKSK